MYSVFIRSEPYVLSLLKMNVQSPYSCHELFGFDIMLDENVKPWILEVNISPRWDAHTHTLAQRQAHQPSQTQAVSNSCVCAASTPTLHWMFPSKVRWSKTSWTWLASICPKETMWWEQAAAPPAVRPGRGEGGEAVVTVGGAGGGGAACNYINCTQGKTCNSWINVCV